MKQYLIYEGLDVVGKVTLLAQVELLPLVCAVGVVRSAGPASSQPLPK